MSSTQDDHVAAALPEAATRTHHTQLPAAEFDQGLVQIWYVPAPAEVELLTEATPDRTSEEDDFSLEALIRESPPWFLHGIIEPMERAFGPRHEWSCKRAWEMLARQVTG